MVYILKRPEWDGRQHSWPVNKQVQVFIPHASTIQGIHSVFSIQYYSVSIFLSILIPTPDLP